MHINHCHRLPVYRYEKLLGLVNLVGSITLMVVLALIGMLISHIPDMMELANQTMN
jgi:hypothetical protein